MIRVADYIMQRLVEEKVHHLFLVTGRGMLYLSDAAAKQEGLECISVHNEQAGAYSAMAYAQANNHLGACMVSTGCAGTNAITGVLCAWQDDIPCVFISGQNTLKETTHFTNLKVRTFGQQEADIVKIVEPITKYAVMIDNPERIVYEMDKALFLAQNGRKGPVWIDVPLDVQNMRIEPEAQERFKAQSERKVPKQEDVAFVKNILQAASRPVLLIGSGVRSADAIKELEELVEKIKIPVVYSNSAVDILESDNPYSIGAVAAMAGNRAGNFAVQNADVVLVLGNRLTTMTVGNDKDKFARSAKIIWVDIDENEPLKQTVNLDKFIHSDAKYFINKLLDCSAFEINKEWVEKCFHWKKIFPKCEDERKLSEKVDLYYLTDALSNLLQKEACLVCDSGLEELITPTTVRFNKNQQLIQPASQGAMGYALPAAIGAYLATKKQVVVVVGDGSVMMNLQELQTIKHYNLPIKVIVLNNNVYAVIRKRQKDLFRTRTVGTDPENGVSCPDFAKVADCFGLSYVKIEESTNLEETLKEVLNQSNSVLCEVMGLEDQTYLHNSFTRTKTGKFVQRPLEDQSPFLDRELFLSEMIIEPIDQ